MWSWSIFSKFIAYALDKFGNFCTHYRYCYGVFYENISFYFNINIYIYIYIKWSSCLCSRVEQLIAFAIISRYENLIFHVTCHVTWFASHVTPESNAWRSYDIYVWREKALGDVCSYSSRSTLMTHTDLSSSAALSRTHLSSQCQEAVGRGLFSCPRVLQNMQNWCTTCKR